MTKTFLAEFNHFQDFWLVSTSKADVVWGVESLALAWRYAATIGSGATSNANGIM